MTNNDLIENPTPRCACMLVLDVSYSMSGEKIDALNEGARQFLREVIEDEFARYAVELGVVTFGGTVATQIPLGPLDKARLEEFTATGGTPMGQAVSTAIDMLEARKEEYKKNGVSYYQPWLVLMTDGIPTDNFIESARKLQRMANEKKIVVFGIGIGEADMSILAQFCPENRPPLKLDGLKFKEFFAWLSASMAVVSQSTPGTTTKLPSTGWAEIEI